MNKMKWMTCTGCKSIVELNATGVCLGCQNGFCETQEDRYMPIETKIEEANNESV